MDADRINELKNRISELPKGNLTKKTINGKAYYYHRFTEDHKRYEKYIKEEELDEIKALFELKASLKKELNTLSNKYRDLYIKLQKLNLPFNIKFINDLQESDNSHKEPDIKEEIRLYTEEKTSEYLHGIKQAFSHLLGIATGPAKKQTKGNEDYTGSLLENADEIKFASIVFNCNNKKFDDYNNLYKSVFENSDVIQETIKEVVPKRELKLSIIPQLMQYQEVFQDNYLSDKVRKFYDQVNDSEIRFSNNI